MQLYKFQNYRNVMEVNEEYIFGQVGKGWSVLISELLRVLDQYNFAEKYIIQQVKEKFGTLRFYYSLSGIISVSDAEDNKIFDLVQEAENKSGSICERCGNSGECKSFDGWLKTLCEPCGEDYLKSRL